ncbi:DUF6506 family protein [Nocardia sp. NPDC050712]|uniref:DUF6506 family protein n=1 Tax=Nocardia sp. NPDC050712 TaxID=3155518 RepID=UPI0033DD6CC2
MALEHWAFIYVADGCDPDRDISIVDTGKSRTVLVGVGAHEQAPAVARRLVADGAQLLELCGGFGAADTAAVLAAIDSAVPVGTVSYGPEAISGLHALFG